MALYSIEESGFKTWMVANMKLWGFIPVLAIWLLAFVIVGRTNSSDAAVSFLAIGFIAAIGASVIFSLARNIQGTLVIYTCMLLLPFLLALGKIHIIDFTTGMKVYMWIGMAVSSFVASVIGVYAYQNAYEILDRLFLMTSSGKDRYTAELAIGYMAFVEAFLFTFLAFIMFLPLFL
ncbi:MAG: hypothetical protein K2H18_02715 [Muribaculaceae bacterium]|nr:hypothetical protein [Muribaculaceae bacterium]